MKIVYTAEATTIGGRNGHSETSDGKLKFDLAVPESMGGTGKEGSNPEQLFACGYSACFGGAIEFAAGKKKKTLKEIGVTARVSFGLQDQGGFGLAVDLDVRLPGVPREEAEALVADADKICPYSKAIRGNVKVNIKVME